MICSVRIMWCVRSVCVGGEVYMRGKLHTKHIRTHTHALPNMASNGLGCSVLLGGREAP